MPKSLTDGQQRLVFGALVVVLVAFGIYLSVGGFGGDGDGKSDQQADNSDGGGGGPATSPPSPIPTEDASDMNVVDWLPFEEDELKAAGVTAQGFGEAYGTIDYSESRKKYYESMEKLATKEYAKTLSESSGAGAMWDQMSKDEAVAEGRANVKSIRSFDDESIVFVVKVQSVTEGSDSGDEDLGDFAITTVKKGDGWKVYDFQPADAGNFGETE